MLESQKRLQQIFINPYNDLDKTRENRLMFKGENCTRVWRNKKFKAGEEGRSHRKEIKLSIPGGETHPGISLKGMLKNPYFGHYA